MSIDTKGIPKADLLMALFNAAIPGALHKGYGNRPMNRDMADALLEETHYFNYVDGRALFVDLSTEFLDAALYDMNNGKGSAARALTLLLVAAAERGKQDSGRDRQMVSQLLVRVRQMS